MAVFQGEPVANRPGARANPPEPLIDRAMTDNARLRPDEVAILEEEARRNQIPERFSSVLEQERLTRGLTPAQAEALNLQREQISEGPRGLDYLENLTRGTAEGIEDLGADYYRGYMDRGSYTMGSLEQNYPELYEREQAIRAGDIDPYLQQIGDQSIDPYLERVQTRGIDPADISRFQDPYMRDVVDASLRDFDVGADRAANVRRARQAGAGAFGGRQGLYDAQLDAEIARQRGGLGAGLRSQGYQQALGAAIRQADLGQRADISDQATMLRGGQTQLQRDLTADRLNQATMLAGGRDQLARDLAAQQATARNIMNRKLQDADLAYQGDRQRLGAIAARERGLGLQSGLAQEYARLGLLGQQIGGQNIGRLFDIGTGQFKQPLQLLTLGTERFGEDRTRDALREYEEESRGSGQDFRFGMTPYESPGSPGQGTLNIFGDSGAFGFGGNASGFGGGGYGPFADPNEPTYA
tara:strand:+ start:480 stop:1889 length:1410 start_codon:yes stop_codon:yes gene_type:complete